MPFPHAVNAVCCVLLILTLIGLTNVIFWKLQRNAENACGNSMCKPALKLNQLFSIFSKGYACHLRQHLRDV